MKLNGYRASHRNKWLLIKNRVLSLQEVAYLEFCADIMCFDWKKQEYGTFKTNFKEISNLFDCKSETTVRNWHNKLLRIGFIQSTNQKNVYKLTCHARYITPGFWKGEASQYAEQEKDQPIEHILQNFGLILQNIDKTDQLIEKNKQDLISNNTPIAISSSKDNSIISSSIDSKKVVVIKQDVVRSDEEYQKMWDEGNYSMLTPEDMKSIDQDLREEIEIESDEQEKEIVRIYFDNDWGKYQKSLLIS